MRRKGAFAVLVGVLSATIVAALSMATTSTAAESSETTIFAADGIALASLGPHYVETGFTSATARADGGFVAQRPGQLDTFLPDGAPDPAAPPVTIPMERQMFPAAGGKSLVLAEGKLTRLNPDGSPDTTFGGTGTIEARFVEAVVELGSGKIAEVDAQVVGTNRPVGQIEITLLNADGSVDRGTGRAGLGLPTERDIEVREIVPMADGGALIVDESSLIELLPDGTVNSAFGEKGQAPAGVLASAHFDPDGSIEAVARSNGSGTGRDLALYRFSATGKAETAFGTEGIRSFDLGGEEEANTASWAADGSVIVAGNEEAKYPCPPAGCETEPILAAFDAAGNLETGFGEGGVLRLSALAGPLGTYKEHGAMALTRRPDGSIVVAGNAPPEETVAFLAGVSPAGGLIPSFGEGGIVRVREPVPAGQALAGIAALPDGSLLAAGTTELGTEDTPVLIRYAADGSLDPPFGGGAGYVILGRSGVSLAGFAVHGEAALTSLEGKPRSRLSMLGAATGQPVSTFGADGSVALPKGVRVTALAFAKDGDPLVLTARRAGRAPRPSTVLRYLPDGNLDKAFGRGGKARLEVPGHGEVIGASLALGAGGTILVGGRVGGRFALGSLRTDGRPNPRFGSRGWSLVNGGGPAEYELATPSRDGSHIYLAGCIGNEERNQVVLMRFDRLGRLDSGFGRRGLLTAPYSRPTEPRAIVPGRDGVLVVTDSGPRPMLTFTAGGKVRRTSPGTKPQFVREVRGTVAGGRLILAWSSPLRRYPSAERSYLSERPLHP